MDELNSMKKLAGLLTESGPDGLDKLMLDVINGGYGFGRVTQALEETAESLYARGIPAHHIRTILSRALHFVDAQLDTIVDDIDPEHPGGTQSSVGHIKFR